MAAHKKTRLKTQFEIEYDAHIKVKSLFYFLLEPNLSKDNEIKSEIMQLFSGCCFLFLMQFSYLSVLFSSDP